VRQEKPTIRELYRRSGVTGSARIGTPSDIADAMQEWFENGACDGFNITPAHLPGGCDDFVELVVPELQRRGLFRTEYEGKTLRENLALKRPDLPRQGRLREMEAACRPYESLLLAYGDERLQLPQIHRLFIAGMR
jgi:hypothetical protein